MRRDITNPISQKMRIQKEYIQRQMQPLKSATAGGYPAAIEDYFEHYGLNIGGDGIEHYFGSLPSWDVLLAGHICRVERAKGCVVCLHGYMHHCGQLKHLIRNLVENGYSAAAFDLPGHGLSDGEESAIEDFGQYRRAMSDFFGAVKQYCAGPYHFAGFSLGAAIGIDHLLNTNEKTFEKVVLAAPLLRWSLYEQSKGTFAIYSRFTSRIPRFFQKNSSDKEFLVFNRTADYLHRRHLSLKWVKALFDWNEMIEKAGASPRPALVLQGDRDGTVQWEHNVSVIREKLPNARIEMIEGARHELFNESTQYREKTFNTIEGYLENGTL